jgi:rifampicin phosphotransferase
MSNVSSWPNIEDEELTTTENRKESPLRTHLSGVVLGGFAAAFGTAEGPAVIVTDPSDLSSLAGIPEGAVLVSGTAHPNLTMVISRIAALVAEKGGILSVAAEAARANSIPAVVGATGLTMMISDGDTVRVDGRNGVVKVIRRG